MREREIILHYALVLSYCNKKKSPNRLSRPCLFKTKEEMIYKLHSHRQKQQTLALFGRGWTILMFVLCTITPFVMGREIVATNEWQWLGPNDTVPAGLEIRMDLTNGGKWARSIQPSEQQHQRKEEHHEPRCGPSCKERQRARRAGLRGGIPSQHEPETTSIIQPPEQQQRQHERNQQQEQHDEPRCGQSCKERQRTRRAGLRGGMPLQHEPETTSILSLLWTFRQGFVLFSIAMVIGVHSSGKVRRWSRVGSHQS